MTSKVMRLASILAAVGGLAVARAEARGAEEGAPGPLRKGDRVVFLGDSITQQGGGPKGYVTRIRKALEEDHQDLGIEVINAGISGHKVPDLERRLDRDVIAKKPTVVVIYVGINDVWHGAKTPPSGTSKAYFEAGLKEIVDRCRAAGARVLLCTPSVIGERRGGANPLDAELDAYSEIGRRVARERGVGLCDLRRAFLDHEREHNPEDKDKGILTTDTVHLNDAGNQLVAEAILKCLGKE